MESSVSNKINEFEHYRDLLQQNLVLIRKAAGWSAETLAGKIGVTKPTILNIENNVNKMSQPIYMSIMCVLSDEVEQRDENDILRSVLGLVFESDSLNDDNREEALAFVSGLSQAKKINEEKANKTLSAILGGVAIVGITGLAIIAKALLKKK